MTIRLGKLRLLWIKITWTLRLDFQTYESCHFAFHSANRFQHAFCHHLMFPWNFKIKCEQKHHKQHEEKKKWIINQNKKVGPKEKIVNYVTFWEIKVKVFYNINPKTLFIFHPNTIQYIIVRGLNIFHLKTRRT